MFYGKRAAEAALHHLRAGQYISRVEDNFISDRINRLNVRHEDFEVDILLKAVFNGVNPKAMAAVEEFDHSHLRFAHWHRPHHP